MKKKKTPLVFNGTPRMADWQLRLKKIDKLRDKLGYTVREACAKMGISDPTYWNWTQRLLGEERIAERKKTKAVKTRTITHRKRAA